MTPGRLTYLQQQEAKQKPTYMGVQIYRLQSIVLAGGPPLTRKERFLQAFWMVCRIVVQALALLILAALWAFCQYMVAFYS